MAEVVDYTGRTRKIVSDDVQKADFNAIPIISLKAITEPGANEKDKQALVKELQDACMRVGFFYVKDHGIETDLLDKLFSASAEFFQLSEVDKQEINFKKSPIFRGYEPLAAFAETAAEDSEKGKKAGDLKEAFNFGYESAADPQSNEQASSNQPSTANAMTGDNVWPSRQPQLKHAVFAYYGQVLELARKLIQILALALELPENYFDSMVKTPGCLGRLLHYPAQPANQSAQGIGAHSDIECLTILAQGSDVSCLQVLNDKGQWIEAPPMAGTFVVNLGDMLARWTNNRFLSTVHRVINKSGKERYSCPVFFGVSYDTMIETIPTCLKEGEQSPYEPILAGDYVYKRLERSRLGKKYDEKSKIDRTAHVVAAA